MEKFSLLKESLTVHRQVANAVSCHRYHPIPGQVYATQLNMDQTARRYYQLLMDQVTTHPLKNIHIHCRVKTV